MKKTKLKWIGVAAAAAGVFALLIFDETVQRLIAGVVHGLASQSSSFAGYRPGLVRANSVPDGKWRCGPSDEINKSSILVVEGMTLKQGDVAFTAKQDTGIHETTQTISHLILDGTERQLAVLEQIHIPRHFSVFNKSGNSSAGSALDFSLRQDGKLQVVSYAHINYANQARRTEQTCVRMQAE